ncbi:MAG: protein translocase subunit SecD [Phycisphaerales bacterium]|nr:protein translocase subunit SecD [Phycisphaerales bacterium]
MHRSIRNLIFITLVLIFFGWAIVPPSEQLRLGKDLRGGATLVYELDIAPGEDAKAVVQRTIDVLKQRIDPNGLLEVSIVAQGQNRIEISMPLPGPRVKKQRAGFEAALERLTSESVDASDLRELLIAEPDARPARIDAIAGQSARVRGLLEDLLTTRDAYTKAEHDLRTLPADATPEARAALVDHGSELLRRLRTSQGQLLRSAPTADEVREAIGRSPQQVSLWDSQARTTLTRPSPRERAVEDLKERYPDAAGGIDETVKEYLAYEAIRKSLDDPSDLVRLVRDAGVLSFRITVDANGRMSHPDALELRQRLRELGPRRAGARDARWFKINKIDSWYDDLNGFRRIFGTMDDPDPAKRFAGDPAGYFASYGGEGYVVEEYDGEFWMLCWDQPGSRLTHTDDGVGQWSVAGASAGVDQQGRPAINFRMDANGSLLLGRLTGANVSNNMAVLLDDQVYTAPNLNSKISSSGQIMGNFAPSEIDYIVRLLSAGSLQAKLSPEPLSQSTVGPELGIENLRKSFKAGIIALVLISAFMWVYYFKFGLIAVIALLCNAVLIVGAMALNKAVFTLPGIAGVILTFGMAVDSNVLIYERIREELEKGLDLRAAVRLGFSKAMSSIVDGNITNLIVCIVLVMPGVSTQEVKGFAITLGIGVLATLFAALVISRGIFTFAVEVCKWRKASMLPMRIAALQRALTPNINWLRLRWIFVSVSSCYIALGLFAVFHMGARMLDTEFRGGTQVVIQFKTLADGSRLSLTRADVVDRLNAASERIYSDDDPSNDLAGELRFADVLGLEPGTDERGNTVADRYSIKTTITDSDLVQSEIKLAFEDELDERPPIEFADKDGGRNTHVFPITANDLRSNFPGNPWQDYANPDVTPFVDGVAILVENLEPMPTLVDLRNRLEALRQAEHPESLARTRQVIPLRTIGEGVQAAAIIVRDARANFSDPGQTQEWENLAAQEWEIVSNALSRSSSLAGVDKFSSSIAQTFRSRAAAAIILSLALILIYIWIRFGNLRYSFGAIVCLIHDCLTVLGLIALSEILYDHNATQGIARSLGLLPFKIDLNMVAAMLTIMGYSLNDTIIVFDRIRETKGKLKYASTRVINEAINSTISRTLITSGTTVFAALIIYLFAGEAVRAFAFALLMGVGVGTYSSVAVAAPIVWSPKHDRDEQELIAKGRTGP